MVTLEQLQALESAGRLWGAEIHYNGMAGSYRAPRQAACTRTVGPRGGITEKVTRVRPSGGLQTWKRDPERFRLPVKYGLRESSAITQDNAGDWHLAADCPLATAEMAAQSVSEAK